MSDALRVLPSVSVILEHHDVAGIIDEFGRRVVVEWVRESLDKTRQRILSSGQETDRQQALEAIVVELQRRALHAGQSRVRRVINATGVVLHTGLGRAVMSDAARDAMLEAAGASNVELDMISGQRRHRGYQLKSALQTLTGCEDVLVVNNNAAATLLTLQALCQGQDVVISRGELIEIGGSFRLPDIFELSGAKLREVGTTNRTHVRDYAAAICPETAAVMKVHPSNYRIVGFCDRPSTKQLAELAHRHDQIMIDDIGSGCLIDVTAHGLPAEPTFVDSINDGADVILGSGDKLLGGPQCGIIIGKAELIEKIRSHPMARAVRVDKLTLASLSATLETYLRDRELNELPVWQMLTASVESLETRAKAIMEELSDLESLTLEKTSEQAAVGGGSLPAVDLPTVALNLTHPTARPDAVARELRTASIRVVPRTQNNRVLVDLRSVVPSEDSSLVLALRLLDRHLQSRA